jgi:transposase
LVLRLGLLAAVLAVAIRAQTADFSEVGAAAATFPSAKHLASWIGVCPGEEESAGISTSNRSPKGNRQR